MDKPCRFTATPVDIDAWLREELADDCRLAFYQWIGALAVTDEVPPRPGATRRYRVTIEEIT